MNDRETIRQIINALRIVEVALNDAANRGAMSSVHGDSLNALLHPLKTHAENTTALEQRDRDLRAEHALSWANQRLTTPGDGDA